MYPAMRWAVLAGRGAVIAGVGDGIWT